MAGIQRFGIFSPAMGLREDFPTLLLPEAYTVESENVQVRWGEIHRVWGKSAILATVGAGLQVLKYHWFIKNSGVGYLFAFTAQNVYKWNGSAWVAHCDATLSVTDYWSVVTYNDEVWATNNIDKVIKGDDSTSMDVALNASGILYATASYMTRCKFLTTFQRYLIAGYTVEQSGDANPHRLRWCDYDDSTDWSTDDADYLDVSGDDVLTGAGTYRNFLIVFKRSSYHQMWLATTDYVFGVSVLNDSVGCDAPDSIVNGRNGDLYFYGSDKNFREIQRGEVSHAVDPTVQNIPEPAIPKIQGWSMDVYGELWWAISDPDNVATVTDPVPGALTGALGITITGEFTGVTTTFYKVRIDGGDAPDTFEWSNDNGVTWVETDKDCITVPHSMENGLSVTFDATTGYATSYDSWTFTATPTTNNTILTFKPKEAEEDRQIWGKLDTGVQAFGRADISTVSRQFIWGHASDNNSTGEDDWISDGVTFAGSGTDDLTAGGPYTGTDELDIVVKIDGDALDPETFTWSDDGGSTWEAAGVACTVAPFELVDGMTVSFGAVTGHTDDDIWEFDVIPPEANSLEGVGYTTWLNWNWEGGWDGAEGSHGHVINIGGDNAGETYSLIGSRNDDGTAITGTVVLSTDMSPNQGDAPTLTAYKRLLNMRWYFRGESDSEVTISISTDHDTAYVPIGAIDITSDREIVDVNLPCDVRGRHFRIKVTGTDIFRLVGVTLEYVLAGER